MWLKLLRHYNIGIGGKVIPIRGSLLLLAQSRHSTSSIIPQLN
jgi:hypothetical protein